MSVQMRGSGFKGSEVQGSTPLPVANAASLIEAEISHVKLHLKSFFFDQTGRFFGQRRRSCETSQKWHGFSITKLVVLAAGLNSKPQNIEGWKRFAKSFLRQTEYNHSTFGVGRSTCPQCLETGARQI
jgi:hypothetical protein